MSGFDRLTPALQYQIVNALGFSGLRPVQEQAIDAICDGKNVVVLAPTAGGKTEAAFFPLLSEMDKNDWEPVSVIYIAPIRALLNNQEHRLEKYAQLIGRRAFKWHGDVGPTDRKKFLADPADILLTTPESLEVMLISQKIPAKQLFGGLQAVVVDEVHAFVGDDRGGHLSSVLERLSRFAGRDVQRIGLSATVGNPPVILDWAAGSSKREKIEVNPGGAKKKPEIELDYVKTLGNAARIISQMHRGEKRLVFVDSRRRVEELGKALRELDVDTHVIHSSLSIDERERSEAAFQEGKDKVIVATSALELGIDIGDLDRVIQIDAPSTVASFLQRMGRTGRRDHTVPNCLFLATDNDKVTLAEQPIVQAAALLRLHERGFVESLPLRARAPHLLAHQLMAICLQESGAPTSDWWSWISSATPFQGLDDTDRDELVRFMLSQGILFQDGGKMWLGERGERLYGRRNFGELYAVFSTPKVFTVMHGHKEVGNVDAQFVEQSDIRDLSFHLGATTWQATRVDTEKGIIEVVPSKIGRAARWFGFPRMLGHNLCQAMQHVLASEDVDAVWSSRANTELQRLRTACKDIAESGAEPLPLDEGYRLWTFAGGAANMLLARTLGAELGPRVNSSNLYLSFQDRAGQSEVGIKQALRGLLEEGRPSHRDAVALVSAGVNRRLSKFQPCLPERLEAEYLADYLTEPEVARNWLGSALGKPVASSEPDGSGGAASDTGPGASGERAGGGRSASTPKLVRGHQVHFDPAFAQGGWPGPLGAGATASLGVSWVGTAGFVSILETALGLLPPPDSELSRAAAIVANVRGVAGYWSASGERDPLGTALRLLRDRDLLTLHGWRGQALTDRLGGLAKVTSGCALGLGDRLWRLCDELVRCKAAPLDEVVLYEERSALPAAVHAVISAVEAAGVSVRLEQLDPVSSNGDLAGARTAGFAPKADGSLALLRTPGPVQAAEEVAAWLAAQPDWQGTVIIGGDEVLDRALVRHGLPSTGQGTGLGPISGVLPLAIDAGWFPADPARVHELLTLEPGPVPRRLARRLARALSEWPAVGSPAWQDALEKGLGHEEPVRKERLVRCLSVLFGPAAGWGESYPRQALDDRVEVLLEWVDAEAPEVGLVVRQQVEELVQLADALAPGRAAVPRATVARILQLVQEHAGTSPHLPAQAGLATLDDPAALVGPASRVIWWGFRASRAPRPPRFPLGPAEKRALSEVGCTLDPGAIASRLAERWGRPLLQTEHGLVLVCPEADEEGRSQAPHPLWDEVLARAAGRGDLEAIVVQKLRGGQLPKAAPVKVREVPIPVEKWRVPASLGLDLRDRESPSSLSKFLGCSLSWALTYRGGLCDPDFAPPTGASELLAGRVAHYLFERVLADEKDAGSAAAASERLFDAEGPLLAAPFFLPAHLARTAVLKDLMYQAVHVFFSLVEESEATIAGIEELRERAMDGWALRGRLDARLADPDLIVDFKWGRYTPAEHLRHGTALQLAAYAEMCRDGDVFPKAGYFILRTQELLTEPGTGVSGANEISTGPISETWGAALSAVERRRAQMESMLMAPGAEGKNPGTRMKKGELVVGPPCRFCNHGVLCGREFEQ